MGVLAAVASAASVLVGSTAAAGAFDADVSFAWACVTGIFLAAGIAGTLCGCASTADMSAVGDSWRAAITMAMPTTQITPRPIARELIAHGKRMEFLAPAEFFNRIDRGGSFAFFRRSDILLSEILWSLRSAQSRYRIDRSGFFAFFTRTESSSEKFLGASGLHRANAVPARDWRSPSVTHCGNPGWCHKT
jgi:hypothetical protein